MPVRLRPADYGVTCFQDRAGASAEAGGASECVGKQTVHRIRVYSCPFVVSNQGRALHRHNHSSMLRSGASDTRKERHEEAARIFKKSRRARLAQVACIAAPASRIPPG